MRTPLKILLGLAGFVLVLFIALVVTVTVTFDPDDYRGYLVDAVEDATGRHFELEGELGLDLFPCCSLTIGPARLGNPQGFPGEHFASLGAASASLELWPLLIDREVSIGTVTLERLDVTLVRLQDGRVNWEMSDTAAPETDSAAAEAAPPALQVGGIRLTGGRVHYRDEQTGTAYAASDVEVSTGRIDLAGERMTIRQPSLAATASGAEIPGGEAVLEVAAQAVELSLADDPSAAVTALEATADVVDTRLTLSGAGRFAATGGDADGTFRLTETSPRDLLAALGAAPYQPADDAALTRLSAQAGWRLAGTTVSVDGLEVRLDDSRLSGSASAQAFGAGEVQVALAVDAVDVARYLPAPQQSASGGAPAADAGLLLQNVALKLSGDLEQATFSLTAGVQNGQLSVDGRGALGSEQPALDGTLTVSDLSPRRLLEALDAAPETADPAVLEHFSGRAAWTASASAAALRDMRWRLDDTGITGRIEIDDFDTAAARFDLALDRIDLDAYLPADEPQPAAPEEAAAQIPLELIRELILDGRLRVGELVMLETTLTDVLAEVHAVGGVLRLDPVSAGLYGGQYSGNVVVDATGTEAELTVNQKLAAVQVGEIARSLFDSDLLAGSLSLELHGAGLGNTPADLLRGLAADVSIDLSDGVYRGMDVLHELRRARALLRNEAAPEAPAAKQTPIQALSASGRMVDGVLQTNRLRADAGGLALQGHGGIDLLELALDYQLDARFPQAAASAAQLGDLAGLSIPLAISGPLTAPRVAVDLTGLVTGNLRSTLEQRAREVLQGRLGGDAPTAGGATAPTDSSAANATPTEQERPAAAPDPAPSAKDLLKRSLRDLLKPPPSDE